MQFNVGDTYQTHKILIIDDTNCEGILDEEFFSIIFLNSGVQPIHVINPQATVTIGISGEVECSELHLFVNLCAFSLFILILWG